MGADLLLLIVASLGPSQDPQLDANERLDIVQTASIALGRVVARVSERLSDEMHSDGD